MNIATKAPVSETRIGFTGVGFDVYERLIRATPARTAVRMAYDGKDLEIMVKGPVHDHYGRLLDRLITAVAVVLGIRRQALGETTWIRPEIERGLEADQCYVFDAGKLAVVDELLCRNENDVAGYPNPDLAVEVDISRPQTDRPAIYAALEVPELWTFDSERVTIAQLSGGTPLAGSGHYVDTGRSRWIPVTASDATRWLVSEDSRDMDAWEERVRAWAELLPRAEGGGT
ncbi:MAG: Uma2 family endonuclease [Isosphaeraceae bacterium]